MQFVHYTKSIFRLLETLPIDSIEHDLPPTNWSSHNVSIGP